MLASECNLSKQLSGGQVLLLCRTVAIPPNCEERWNKMTPVEQTHAIINEKAEEQWGPGWNAASTPVAKVYSFVGKSAAEVGAFCQA